MVDIIIPVYNSRDTLSRTLASITYQNTNYDFKVTIIDDSSDEAYDDIQHKLKRLVFPTLFLKSLKKITK